MRKDNLFKHIHIAVIGLGYVGLPLMQAFAKIYPTMGFDINKDWIKDLKKIHPQLDFSFHPKDLQKANVYIVAVPTPVDSYKKPDLSCLLHATKTIAKVLKQGDIVVYESTTYPTCTQKECIPLLEKISKLKLNQDFFVGYSPERINSGDKIHTLENITKIVSGSTKESAEKINQLYKSIIKNTYLAPSIEVAEAAKAIENAQRDLNIAFVNELCMIFDRLNIPTDEVLKAASTKWNFLPFTPGLVGGHCIGVDPYYLVHIAEAYGFHPRVISSGRFVNDLMPSFIAQKLIKLLAQHHINPLGARIAIFGASFKENCEDLRNSKVFEVTSELKDFGCEIEIFDSLINPALALKIYKTEVAPLHKIQGSFDAFLLAIAHDEFLSFDYANFLKNHGFIFDIKGVLKGKNLPIHLI